MIGGHRDPTAELADDARRLFAEIDPEAGGPAAGTTDCRPALDVIETATAVEVIADLPGVPASSVRVAMRQDTLLIVGSKTPATFEPRARFHVAERSYGRFVRAVRLSGAFDLARARAHVAGGQLRVVLPLIVERRGALLPIPVNQP